MSYAHSHFADQAKTVANFPASALHRRFISGVTDRLSVSVDGRPSAKRECLTPGHRRELGIDCRQLAIGDNLEAGGIEPPSCDPSTIASTCVVR